MADPQYQRVRRTSSGICQTIDGKHRHQPLIELSVDLDSAQLLLERMTGKQLRELRERLYGVLSEGKVS